LVIASTTGSFFVLPTNQAFARSINFAQKMGRRRAIELDWKPARLTPTKEPDPTLEAYKKHSKKELGYLLSTWRSERQLSLRQAAKELGVSHVAIWLFEMGQKRLPKRIWEAIGQP
jgi:DNA-binding XRE family transcriptional regulator